MASLFFRKIYFTLSQKKVSEKSFEQIFGSHIKMHASTEKGHINMEQTCKDKANLSC